MGKKWCCALPGWRAVIIHVTLLPREHYRRQTEKRHFFFVGEFRCWCHSSSGAIVWEATREQKCGQSRSVKRYRSFHFESNVRLGGFNFNLNWMFQVKSNMFIHRSIALGLLYRKPFGCYPIRESVRPQNPRWNVVIRRKKSSHAIRFRYVASDRLVLAFRTKYQKCRARRELSIGIHLINIRIK